MNSKPIRMTAGLLMLLIVTVTIKYVYSTVKTAKAQSSINNTVDNTAPDTMINLQNYKNRIDELKKQQEQIETELESQSSLINPILADNKNTDQQVQRMQQSVGKLEQQLRSLTTENIQARLDNIEVQVTRVSEVLAELNDLMTPEIRSNIWKVKTMREELNARKELEKNIDTKFLTHKANVRQDISQLYIDKNELSERITGIEGEQRTLLYWLLGGFATVILTIITVMITAVKKLADTYKFIPRDYNAENVAAISIERFIQGISEATNRKASESTNSK